MQNFFQSILVVAMSESKTNEFEKEFNNLQTLISLRPDSKFVETLNRIYAEKNLNKQ